MNDADYVIIVNQLFHDGGPYHIETSPLICRANQWTYFHKIESSIMKELSTLRNYTPSSARTVITTKLVQTKLKIPYDDMMQRLRDFGRIR